MTKPKEIYTDEKGIVHGGPYDGMEYQDAMNQYSKDRLEKYYKEKAEQGGKTVRDATSSFAQDFITPALRVAASLYGPTSIGLTAVDATNKAKQGDYVGAAAEVAFEIASGFKPTRSKTLNLKKAPKWHRKMFGPQLYRGVYSAKKSRIGNLLSGGKEVADQAFDD